jgi:hypothetical protein
LSSTFLLQRVQTIEGRQLGRNGCLSRQQRHPQRLHVFELVDHDRHARGADVPGHLVAQRAQANLLGPRRQVRAHRVQVVFHGVQGQPTNGQRQAGDRREPAERGHLRREAGRERHERRAEVGAVASPALPEGRGGGQAFGLDHRPEALDEHQQRRGDQEGRAPTQQHAGAADEAEVAEPAKVGHRQRAIGRARGERCRQGRLPHLHDRLGERLLGRAPGASQLEVARHEQQAEVDAVAGDDGEQEPGGDVEPPDGERGEPERPRHS